MTDKTYFITTAIAYTSRVPHIGNTYEAVLADAIARYKRLEGYDVFLLTGTDEHGQKIEEQAVSEGETPQQHVDRIAGEIRRIWDFMNVSYDKFIRTTDPDHVQRVQKIFRRLYEQGDIYKGSYEGLYCVACESFFTESQAAEGNTCPDCGTKLKTASEEAYFFKLSKYTERLAHHIEENPDFIQPESRKNEMLNNFIKPGLQDLCVSRTSFKWGIPVDFDDKHVIYVWIDALSNYITAMGYDVDGSHGALFKKFWPAQVHLIGKDILRFHTIYWPIMLMALGVELPAQIFGHPWLLSGNDKMSKSKGNVIYAEDLVGYFGVDAVRYFLLHEMPFAQDGTFTHELVISRINSDLANILGNLVNRTVAMVGKYFDGVLPAPGAREPADEELIAIASALSGAASSKMEKLRVADTLDEIWTLLRRSNKYIDETTPWLLARDESKKQRLGTVLYNLIECIRIASVLLSAFLPETAQKIQQQIGADKTDWQSVQAFGATAPGSRVGQAVPLFERIDEVEKMKEIEAHVDARLKSAQTPAEKSEAAVGEEQDAPLISIDDFSKVELKAAKVLSCEPVPKSNKLLRLMLDAGEASPRQVVSGIASWYRPEDLVGKTIVFVSNLMPVKLRGVDSNGMILAADNDENDVRVLFLEGIRPGAKIR